MGNLQSLKWTSGLNWTQKYNGEADLPQAAICVATIWWGKFTSACSFPYLSGQKKMIQHEYNYSSEGGE